MKLIVLALFSIGIIESVWAEDWQVRVRELEGRVANMEYRLSVLETEGGTGNLWTCNLIVFDRTYIGTGKTKGIALATVIKKCLDAIGTNIWCKASATVCSNE